MADNSSEIRRHIDATSKEIELFVLRLEKILGARARKLIKDLTSTHDFTRDKAKDAVAVIAQLEQVLSDAGLQEQLGELRQMYGKELGVIRDVYFADLANKKQFYSGVDADVVEALIKFDTDKVLTHVTSYVGDVRGQLMRSVLVGDVPSFEDIHDQAFSVGQLQTEIQTLYSSFSRTVIAKKAKDVGFDKFIYLGPLDKITRPFCRHLLEAREPPVYSEEEINKMDNGQTGDVMTTAGGYNCRHQWRPVSGED